MNSDLVKRLQDFIESEARSCSMDPGCITPEYVYRMWSGRVTLEEIEEAFMVHGLRFLDKPSGKAERKVHGYLLKRLTG